MKKVKICFISDTHGQHHDLKIPDGIDIIIHCGDMSSTGTRGQVTDFLDWYSSIDVEHKVLIPGNHDFFFEPHHPRNFTLADEENHRDIIPSNIIYLENETVEVEGIKIFGSPWTPWFYNWAFNAQRGEKIAKHWEYIQPGTDIVVTHGPPSNTIGDRCSDGQRVGCDDLYNKVVEIKPIICSFGHIHEGFGVEDIEIDGHTVKMINCSVLNLNYELVNEPTVIDWPLEK